MIRHDYFICRLNSPYTGSYTVLYSVASSVHFVKFSCLNAGGVKKKRKRKKRFVNAEFDGRSYSLSKSWDKEKGTGR